MATIDELISRKPKNRKEAETLVSDINKKIAEVQAIRPTGAPEAQQYLLEGVRLTQRGYDAKLKNLRDRLTYVTTYYITNDPFATQEKSRADQLYPQYNNWRTQIRDDLQILRNARNKALTFDEKENLDLWIKDTEKRLAQFDDVLPKLASGVVPTNLPPNYVAVNLNKAKTTPPFSAAPAPTTQPSPASTNISNITTKEQARQEIARLRQRANTLKGLVGEKSGNTVLYYEAPGAPGMSKGQRDSILAGVEARIDALNNKFFAETPAAPAAAAPAATAPGMVGTGLTAGQRGEQGILQNLGRETEPVVPADETPIIGDETPTVVDITPPVETPERITTPDVVADTTPEVVSDTAPIATPTGPSYTDPATGVTYQPGETIGGEDRSLPNGGGVVNGVYIPPGIDYTWLGQQVPSDWEEAAQELYGGYYEMLKQVPELGRLLKEAFEKGWEPGSTSFQYALEQTDWWKTTNASARAWQEKLIRDPATATAERDTRVALLRGVAQDMGITLSPESLEKLATDSIILNFQLTSQYEDVIGSEARKSAGGVSQLRYGFVGDSIRKVANQYGIALSDITFNEWVDKIAVGAESAETFEAYASQTARNLYPSLTSGFERGLTFGQMTDPYAQIASRILEIPWAQVDFTDPKWAAAFTMRNDKGDQTQMSYGEWADYLRTNKSFGYEYTDEAVSKAYTIVNDLAEAFGRA